MSNLPQPNGFSETERKALRVAEADVRKTLRAHKTLPKQYTNTLHAELLALIIVHSEMALHAAKGYAQTIAVEAAIETLKRAKQLVAKGPNGPRGERGEDGLQGEQGPLGPMPQHEWDGPRIRFEQDVNVWGSYSESLQGPRGDRGMNAGAVAGAVVVPKIIGGGGAFDGVRTIGGGGADFTSNVVFGVSGANSTASLVINGSGRTR